MPAASRLPGCGAAFTGAVSRRRRGNALSAMHTGFSTVLSTALVENSLSVMGILEDGMAQSCTHLVVHIGHN